MRVLATTAIAKVGVETLADEQQAATGQIVKLLEPDLRKIWPKEEGDLSPWIRDNVNEISDLLGLDIQIDEAETPVGGFRLDLAGRDLVTQRPVVIENQFGRTNHDHLGSC